MDGLGWRQEFVLFCRPVAQDVADAQGTADMADIDGPAAADCPSRQSQLNVFVLPGRRAVPGLRQAEPVGPLGVVGFTDAVLFQRLVRDEPTPLVFDDFQIFDGFIRDRIGYGRYTEGRVRRLALSAAGPLAQETALRDRQIKAARQDVRITWLYFIVICSSRGLEKSPQSCIILW